MVVAKAAATEVNNYYNCGNEVKVVVENIGLWQPRRHHGVAGSQRPLGVAPYLRQSQGHWVLGWAPRGRGVMEHRPRCRRRWTWSQRVSCRLNGEKEVKRVA